MVQFCLAEVNQGPLQVCWSSELLFSLPIQPPATFTAGAACMVKIDQGSRQAYWSSELHFSLPIMQEATFTDCTFLARDTARELLKFLIQENFSSLGMQESF